MGKISYDVGYIGYSETGEQYEVINYNGRKDITLRFCCGWERKVTSTQIKQGTVKFTKPVIKTKLGAMIKLPDGSEVEVVKYVDDKNISIKFSNGVVKNTSYNLTVRGQVSSTKPLPKILVGQIYSTNYYGEVLVTEVNSAVDIVVQFEDGQFLKTTAHCLRKGSVGHPTSGVPIGYTFTNSDGVVGSMVNYTDPMNCSIQWEDGVITEGHAVANLKRGGVYYPNAVTVSGVGYFGIGKYKPNKAGYGSNYLKVVHQKWVHMLTRCYNEEEQKKPSCKAYIGVTVCAAWHNFQNFATWCEDHLDKINAGFELDKDLLGSRLHYSPENCRFIPRRLNIFLSDNYSNKKLGLPEGVNEIAPKTEGSKVGYVARCHVNGTREYLGYYDCPYEAGEVYRIAKEAEAVRLAEEYREVLAVDEYETLLAYKVGTFTKN